MSCGQPGIPSDVIERMRHSAHQTFAQCRCAVPFDEPHFPTGEPGDWLPQAGGRMPGRAYKYVEHKIDVTFESLLEGDLRGVNPVLLSRVLQRRVDQLNEDIARAISGGGA